LSAGGLHRPGSTAKQRAAKQQSFHRNYIDAQDPRCCYMNT
jgi:hypothetical protein